MRKFALSRIWAEPKISGDRDMDFLERISRFPIQELYTENFDISSWLEIIAFVPQLKVYT